MNKKITWTLEKRKLDQLNPYEHNPRKLTEKGMADLKKSIDKFGLAEPIIINTNNTIIGGHARYFTLLKDKNILFADCYVPNIELTPEEAKELNIRLNKNIAGEFDFDILSASFEFDKLVDWGFDENELDRSLWDNKTDEQLDDVPEPQKEAVSKIGDIFLLDGKHRVMCGDSTKKEDVEILMNGQKADMVFTDIPYGINYSGGRTQTVAKKNYGKIEGDKDSDISSFIGLVGRNDYKRDAYICVSPINLKPVFNTIDKYDAVIVWKKNQPGLGYQWIRRYCEFIVFISKRDKAKFEQSEFDWWEIPTDPKNEYQHGTQKPVALIIRALKFSSVANDLVADWFLGSGSTLIACEQTNRICYGMEIDPIYVDVILRRYYNLYPEKKIECLTRKNFNLSELFKDAKN